MGERPGSSLTRDGRTRVSETSPVRSSETLNLAGTLAPRDAACSREKRSSSRATYALASAAEPGVEANPLVTISDAGTSTRKGGIDGGIVPDTLSTPHPSSSAYTGTNRHGRR